MQDADTLHVRDEKLAHCSNVLLVILIVIVIIVIVGGISLLRIFLCFLRVIVLLLLGLLDLAQCLPLGGKGVCFGDIISDDDVVEDGLGLNLPQIEANETKGIILVHLVIINKLGVVNLLGFPDALVLWIRDPLGRPI